MAAWVLIHNNDKSSLIRHMGSQKGREFIKCKPDIDAELHLFLQNYKKKGKFRFFFWKIYNFGDYMKNIIRKMVNSDFFLGNLQFLVIMQIRCNMETMTQ